jgi:uncharacterized damage-inducible protein DinB
MTQSPDNPAGEFQTVEIYDETVKLSLIDDVRQAPTLLREAVAGLSDSQLNTLYRNWTIRQIVHHIADSHAHIYIRFKWTLTESNPMIKAYEEADWVLLDDCKQGDIEPPLALLAGLHGKWAQVLESMTAAQFSRTFVHPQLNNETVSLWTALNYYPWHAKHHTAQILWLREQNDW